MHSRTDATVVRIGAAQNFVKQKNQRRPLAGHLDNAANAFDFGVETRGAFLQ